MLSLKSSIANFNFCLLLFLLFYTVQLFAQNQNISEGNIFDGEPYIAVNPNNSEHLVIAWMSYINFRQQFQIKTKVSFNGGESWGEAIALPHVIEQGHSSADPCIDFDTEGNVYTAYIDFTGTTPPISGGVYVAKSSDGGLTWAQPMEVISSSFDGEKWPIDRPWMVIDKSNEESNGTIYVTTFNGNRTLPSFNPYLSVSIDGGQTFNSRIIDTTGWLAGNLNAFPMCSPAVSSSGVFYGVYPSIAFVQSPFFRSFLVSSDDAGTSLSHQLVMDQPAPATIPEYPNAKKGGLLLANPADSDHLVFLYINEIHEDLDIFLVETKNAGTTWSEPLRVNDDPIANNRMQDMVWGDFDLDGDLVVSWRDRRNGQDSTYQTSTEMWAAYREKDAIIFNPNFKISSEQVAFNTILESSGNDFMCIKLQDDIINASWGDTRNGRLNIWFSRLTPAGLVVSTQKIAEELIPSITVFPNPSNSIFRIEGAAMNKIKIYNSDGQLLIDHPIQATVQNAEIDLTLFPNGIYIAEIDSGQSKYRKILRKQ